MEFDLGKFRDLAFWREPLPDHPLQDVDDAKRIIGLLPEDDPGYSLADLTNWVATMNATQTFTPRLRGQILMLLDEAARPFLRLLSDHYLAPDSRTGEALREERADGDPDILRALFECASEFAHGFAICLDKNERPSDWVEENLARLYLRHMRWLGRRLALAHMMHLPDVAAIWERLHHVRADAEERGAARTPLPVFEGDRFPSSVTQEYARLLLLELAAPESLRGRQIELVFRIAGRMATHVRLEAKRSTESPFAVVPAVDSRPTLAANLGPNVQPAPLFINTANVLPRLRAVLERDMGRDPKDPDTVFGEQFALGERRAMVDRLLEHWGMDPPKRRARRVAMKTAARVHSGFDKVVVLVPALEKAWWPGPGAVRRGLQLELNDTTNTLARAKLKAERVAPARIADASAGGLGITIRRPDAQWAKHGALLAIVVEPGNDWLIGVLRRIFSEGEELRLGIQVIARKPRAVWFRTETLKDANVWEEAMMEESTFRERHKRGILLEPQPVPLAGGDLLLPPATATRGTQLDLPMPDGMQRIRITRLIDDNEHYQRVLFESLGITKA